MMSPNILHISNIELLSNQVDHASNFLDKIFLIEKEHSPSLHNNASDSIRLRPSNGSSNLLGKIVFSTDKNENLISVASRLKAIGSVPEISSSPHQPESSTLTVADPDGNNISLYACPIAPQANSHRFTYLQHIAIRTPNIESLRDFYVDGIGLTLSDIVTTTDEKVTAIFLRGNEQHHCLALFRSDHACLDHYSFDAPDAATLIAWADRCASLGVKIVWGLGRHGPGDDLFFMVRDGDGTLMEFSTELELCDSTRPIGQWPHLETTLNQWGQAIRRT